MPTSAGLRFAFNDQAGGAVGRKPIARTGAKVWDHSTLESRIERHSIIICFFFGGVCRRLGCAKVRSGCGSKGTSMGDCNVSGIGRRRVSLNHISAPFVDGGGSPIQLYPAKRLGTGTESVTSIKLPSTDPN